MHYTNNTFTNTILQTVLSTYPKNEISQEIAKTELLTLTIEAFVQYWSLLN